MTTTERTETGHVAHDGREFSRSPVKVRVTVLDRGGTPAASVRGVVQDLSMNGVFVRVEDAPLPGVGSDCRVDISLEAQARVEAAGRVARLAAGGMAVQFTEIIGSESFAHLQRLVLYNNARPDVVLEEARRHAGIRRLD